MGLGQGVFVFPHGFSSFELDFVCVVNKAVEDGVGQGGLSDGLVPMFEWDLGGDEGCTPPVAVFDDFEEVAPCLLGRAESGQAPTRLQHQERSNLLRDSSYRTVMCSASFVPAPSARTIGSESD